MQDAILDFVFVSAKNRTPNIAIFIQNADAFSAGALGAARTNPEKMRTTIKMSAITLIILIDVAEIAMNNHGLHGHDFVLV